MQNLFQEILQPMLPYYTTRSSSLYLLLSKVVLDAQVARQMQKLTIHMMIANITAQLKLGSN